MRPTTKTTNLTPARTDLIGRDLEIARLRELLREARLVTVTGIGGTGKTRIAREFGQQAVGDFPGGVWMVELANYDGVDEAMRDLAQMLGVGFEGTASAVSQIVEALRNKPRTLLIFDNLEHVVDEAADPIARIIDRTGGVCVLCTSREPLRIAGEQRFKLSPLSHEAAMNLFERRAREVVPTFSIDVTNRESIAQLVDRLDRLPLAIELAASRINVMPPAQLMNRITERMSALRARDRDRPARHETLSAAIEWSWDLLTPAQRQGLAQCAVFRGGFTLEAVQAVVRCDGACEDLIEDLLERSLIELEEHDGARRFFLFELVRGAAEAKLAQSSECAAAYERHADYFVQLIDDTPQAQIYGRQVELPNLLVALRRTKACQKRARVALAAARILRLTASVGLIEETLSEILAEPDDAPALRAKLLLYRAVAAFERKQFDESSRDSARAIELATEVGDVETAADALTVRGFTLSDLGRPEEGAALLTRGLELARDAGSASLETIALGNLAMVALEDGRDEEAERLFRQSLSRSRAAVDDVLIGRALLNLGVCEAARGNLQESATHLEEALHHHDRVDDDRSRGLTYLALGETRARLGDSAGARDAYGLAREIAHALGKKTAETTALIGLGSLGTGAGDRTYLVQAVELNEGNQHYVDEVRARCHLAVYDLVAGRHELARPGLRRALGVLADRDPRWAGLLWGYLALSYALATDGANAAEALGRAAETWAAEPEAAAHITEIFRHAITVFSAGMSASPADVARLRRLVQAGDAKVRPFVASWPDHAPIELLGRLLDAVLGPEASTRLAVSRDGRRYIPPNLDEVDFSRRGPLRKILVALAEARESRPGAGLSADDVLEAGWPGDIVTVEAGAARVYSAIRTLRTHGLEDVLLTQDDGYLIDPQVGLAWLD